MLVEPVYNASYSNRNIYGAWEQSIWIIKLKGRVEDGLKIKILLYGRKIMPPSRLVKTFLMSLLKYTEYNLFC